MLRWDNRCFCGYRHHDWEIVVTCFHNKWDKPHIPPHSMLRWLTSFPILQIRQFDRQSLVADIVLAPKLPLTVLPLRMIDLSESQSEFVRSFVRSCRCKISFMDIFQSTHSCVPQQTPNNKKTKALLVRTTPPQILFHFLQQFIQFFFTNDIFGRVAVVAVLTFQPHHHLVGGVVGFQTGIGTDILES